MKEILLQRMLEDNYDKGHEDHKMAYEALQKSIIRDESKTFDADKAEERTKKKSKQDSPKTPPGSPPSPPPPPPPDLMYQELPAQSQSSVAPGSSKTDASTTYTAWTTTTSGLKPAALSVLEDYLCMKMSTLKHRKWGLTMKITAVGTFPKDKYGVQMIMRFNEIHKFSEGTLQQIDEALDYRVKEFRVNKMNPGLDTRFWMKKDVDRSKEFMFAIQK
ncbi:hypothetical protein Tco_1509422 [Tanacetum coccineum]